MIILPNPGGMGAISGDDDDDDSFGVNEFGMGRCR